MKSRLSSNPVLRSVIKGGPDMFVYVETLSSGNSSSPIKGYDAFTRSPKPRKAQRGIAVFFKK